MGSVTKAPAQLLRLGVLLGGLITTWAATYDFENGLGPDWKTNFTEQTGRFMVSKVRDRMPGPSTDHTLGTDRGSCAYATGPGYSVLKATVQGPFCFIGWYHQSGVVESSVAYFRSTQGKNAVLFHFPNADMGGRWRRVTYSERRKGPTEIEITSYMSDDSQEYAFAVDDLTVDPGLCKPAPRDGSCDFDWGDACGYSVGNGSDVWNLRDGTMRGPKAFRAYGPDATVGTFTGGYAYFMPQQKTRATGVLTSVTLERSPKDRCLEFYYFIPSYIATENTNISLSLFNDANKSPIWKPPATDLFLGKWTPVKASYKPSSKHKLKFICSIGGGAHMGFYCAVDGIKLIDCKPPEGPGKRFCDFESDWCDWRNVAPRIFPWILQGGTVESTRQRPSKDHTLGNSSGSYLFISNVGRYFHEKAQLINSVSDYDLMTRCMTFWYIVAAGKGSKLRVVAKSLGKRDSDLKETVVWEANSGAFDIWQMGSVAISERTRVMIEGVVGSSPTEGYMVVDDIGIFKNDSCETIPAEATVSKNVNDLLDCTFVDDTLCRWSSPSRGPNDTWLFPSVTEPVSKIGPTPLPNKVKGSYIFLTRKTLSQSRNLKVLESAIVPRQKAPVCGSFYYHMFAAQDCTLSVNVRTHGGTQRFNIGQAVFSHYGRSVADRWYRVQRTIDLDTDENRVEVKVTSVGESAMELGIGPIQFTSGACEIVSDSQGWCDFEYNTCGWKFDSPWRRQMYGFLSLEGKIYKGRSGPLDSEYFMEFKSSIKSNASTVTSPEFTGSAESQCLEFWHQRKVRSDGVIQVELLLDGKNKVLWTQLPYPQDDWMFARVPVQVEQGKNFQVIFRATAGGAREARLRLDDIALRPGACSHLAQCQFSDDLCGYVNGFVDDFRWLIGPGRRFDPTPDTAILWHSSYDRMNPSPVAYIDLTAPAPRYNYPTALKGKDGRQLSLMSPIFEVKDANDTVIVHYVRKGEDILSMKLSQVALEEGTGKPTTLQTNELPAGPKWKKAKMVLKASKYSQITITLTRGPGAKGMAAVSRILITSKLPDVNPTSVTPSQGETSLECDFENGTSCGWETNLGNISWKLNDPSKGIPPFPRSDRTLQAYRGRFLYAQGNTNDRKVTAILRSPEIPQEWRDAFCFSMWTISTRYVTAYVTDPSGKLMATTTLQPLHHWSQSSMFNKLPQNTSRVTLRIPPLYGLVALDDISVKPGRCPESTKCTFEAFNFCEFSQPYDNVVPWRIRLSSVLNTTDHTSGTKQGRVLYLDTTKVDSHHPISRVFFRQRPPTEASCLKFWWKGYGLSSELNVYRFTHETVLRDPIVSLKTRPLPWWSPRTVTVSSKSNWKIVFEVLSPVLVKVKSGVMLDDVEVTDGECPQENVCTFEDDVCYPWTVTKRNTTTNFQGLQHQLASQFKPFPRDHTMPTGDGYYLLLRSAGSRRDKSSLMIREPGRFRCSSFWYYVSVNSNGCIIKAGRRSVPETTKGWRYFQFDLTEQNGFGEGIHVFSGGDTESFAAIDDVVVDEQPCSAHVRPTEQFNCGGNKIIPIERVCDFVEDCPNGADEGNCGSCKFSNDTCGWNFGRGRGPPIPLKWRLARAGEIEKAPRTDHDGYRDGSYMLMHGTKNPLVDLTSVAIAYAPVVRNVAATCQVIFWYNYATQNHIVDVDFGILRPPMFIPIWSLNAFPEKPPEKSWKRAIVFLGRFAGEAKLYFRAMESPVSYGYFAIDEIEFKNCGVPAKQSKCEKYQFQCSNGACVLSYDVCNYVDDCGDLSDETNCGDYSMGCNFDGSFCEWRPRAGATPNAIWKREGPYSYLKKGPSRDHTSGINEGKFLILRASQTDVDAEIAGPVLKPGKCWISFFHTIVGGSDSVLTLNVRNTSNGPLIPIWRSSGPGFPQFIKGFHTFNQETPYQVVFRGTHAAATRDFGYIAIDDVSFGKDCVPHNETLPKAPSSPAIPVRPSGCPGGHFTCLSSRQCIPPEQICDFHEDCPDGSDEAQCGACDFTTGMCGLTNQYPNSRFAWNWTSTSMVVSDPVRFAGMPTRDGKNNRRGSYCAFRLINPSVLQGYINPLMTPPLGRVASTCMVSFYAFAGQEPTHLLLFGVQWYPPSGISNTPMRKVFALLKGSDTNTTWTKVTVKVGNWPRGVRFYFQTNLIHASIDEIKFSHCHPDKDNKAWQATTTVTCNFENDTNCAWFPDNTNTDLNWVRYSGGRITNAWQPSRLDLKNSGAYMYATNPLPAAQRARMVSKTLSPTQKAGRCLSFWYNMWHPNSGRLDVRVHSEDNSTELVWTREGTQGKGWRISRAIIKSDFQHQIVLDATFADSTPAVIAVDYITLLQGPCQSGKQQLNCDFTAGSCAWMPHNWKITEGESAIIPRIDHTTESGSGGFAMLKRTGGRLMSSQLNTRTSSTKCLRFWYYLSGGESEELTVSRVVNFKEETLLWNVSAVNVPNNQWLSGSTSVDVTTASVLVVFGGSTSGIAWTAVAVDDIRVEDSPCQNAGSCDFEKGDLCNWRNAGNINKNAHWYVTYGSAISRIGGPKGSPKGNATGNYLLLDSQDQSRDPKGVLESELLTYSPTSCLEFYYYMAKGSTPSLLSEIVTLDGSSIDNHKLFGTTDNGAWARVVFQLNFLPPVYQLRFTGNLGGVLRRDIALDEITLIPGNCPQAGNATGAPTAAPVTTRAPGPTIKPVTTPKSEPLTSPSPVSSKSSSTKAPVISTTVTPVTPSPVPEALTCQPSEFNCRDNINCVPLVLLCDGVEDCPNGLDEKCGDRNKCAPDTVFCRSGTPSWCIPRTYLCDGNEDCSDGSDESLCGSCPPNYCQNGGTCSLLEGNRSPECHCSPGTSGVRCNVRNIGAAKELVSSSQGASAASVAVPVVLVLVLLCAGVAGFFYYRRRKVLENAPVFLNNPTYDAETDEARVFT